VRRGKRQRLNAFTSGESKEERKAAGVLALGAVRRLRGKGLYFYGRKPITWPRGIGPVIQGRRSRKRRIRAFTISMESRTGATCSRGEKTFSLGERKTCFHSP